MEDCKQGILHEMYQILREMSEAAIATGSFRDCHLIEIEIFREIRKLSSES